MATDILRGRATEQVSYRPERSVPIWILITLALAVGVVALPEQGASAPVLTRNGWSTTVTASATTIGRGDSVTFRVTVSAAAARIGRVRLAIINPDGRRVLQKVWRPRTFAADTPRLFTMTWQIRADQRLGTYRVRVAVFRADLGTAKNHIKAIAGSPPVQMATASCPRRSSSARRPPGDWRPPPTTAPRRPRGTTAEVPYTADYYFWKSTGG